MPHRIVAAALQDVQEAHDIAVHIGPGILDRIADAGLGGQVDHGVEALRREQRRQRLAVGEVHPHEAEPFAVDLRQARFLQDDGIISIEVVQADDFIAASEQTLNQMEADEAGCSRDQDLHKAA